MQSYARLPESSRKRFVSARIAAFSAACGLLLGAWTLAFHQHGTPAVAGFDGTSGRDAPLASTIATSVAPERSPCPACTAARTPKPLAVWTTPLPPAPVSHPERLVEPALPEDTSPLLAHSSRAPPAPSLRTA